MDRLIKFVDPDKVRGKRIDQPHRPHFLGLEQARENNISQTLQSGDFLARAEVFRPERRGGPIEAKENAEQENAAADRDEDG
jgi:hypothetical protein